MTDLVGSVQQLNNTPAPQAPDLGVYTPIEPTKGYVQTEGGLLLSEEVLKQNTPFEIGEKVPFKGWMFRVTDIGPGSITLTVCGRTGLSKRAASRKAKYKKPSGTNMTPPKKRRKSRRKRRNK